MALNDGDKAYDLLEKAGLMGEKAFSRNASSSRANPVKRMIEGVMRDPYIPIHRGKNQREVQAFEEHDAFVNVGMPCAFNFSAPHIRD